jgi:hypothetical protein
VETPRPKLPRALSSMRGYNTPGNKDSPVGDSLRPQTSLTPMDRLGNVITDEGRLRVLVAEAEEEARIDLKARDRATRFAPPWY